MSGKGSAPRPIPNRKQFEDNWDRIFSKKAKALQDEPKLSQPIKDGLMYAQKKIEELESR